LDAPASPFFFIPLCPRGAVLPILCVVLSGGGFRKKESCLDSSTTIAIPNSLAIVFNVEVSLSLTSIESNAGYVL